MMANHEKKNECPRSTSKKVRWYLRDMKFSSSSSSEEEVATGCDPQQGQEVSRREVNPFSFKHFLKNSQTNYCAGGARPRIYTSPPPSPNKLEKDSTVYSRNPTELPDFVQDHLVLEQCYLNHEATQQNTSDVDNLPDFTLNSVEQRQNRRRNESEESEPILHDYPFDLTGSIAKTLPSNNQSPPNASCSAHLNFWAERPESSGFPLDLPILGTEPDSSPNIAAQVAQLANLASSGPSEASVPKSLPDFLNDDPIHNKTTISTGSGPISNSIDSTERRLLLENEKLRHELEQARKEINEKSKRILILKAELTSRRDVEQEEAAHLEKAMEQVEDNLKRSTRRVVNAEGTITSLKRQIKELRLENWELKNRTEMGHRVQCDSPNVNQTVRRLANDLRNAASSAEISLRQLMSGVDNLRVLASTLENVDKIEDSTKDFLSDFDKDNS
ncbi:lethal (3) 04053 isoform X1 [Megalopta genalis]|uniref:lethal (3) 04053 isoform X1 n=1 Tax=Megalopta genalis TaxID=115081 RepID=UPI003FCF4FA8